MKFSEEPENLLIFNSGKPILSHELPANRTVALWCACPLRDREAGFFMHTIGPSHENGRVIRWSQWCRKVLPLWLLQSQTSSAYVPRPSSRWGVADPWQQ